MKILIFEQRYTSSKEAGIGRFSLFAKEWEKAGHKIFIISGMINYISGKKPKKYRLKLFVREKESENITILRVFEPSVFYLSFVGRLASYFSFLVSAFFGALFSPRPDVVIASSPPIFIGFLGWLTNVLKRSVFIFEVRDIWPDEAVELGFLKNRLLIKMSLWLEKFLYRKSKFIIANSPGIKEFLTAKKFLSEEKITVIPNPVDLSLFVGVGNVAKKENFGWRDKMVVLYAGAHSAVYDFDLVIKTAEELRDLPILFVFIGSGRQKKDIIKKIEHLGLRNIQLLEPVAKEKLAVVIKTADVGIVPLGRIGLLKHVYATKIFDYMAGAKPIVVAGEGVSADLVCRESKCGLCVKPKDVNSFKAAILDIYNNHEKGERIGRNGFNYLRKNFAQEKLAENFLSVLIRQTSSHTIATK